MGLTLTVLGCSGSYAGPGTACSGYLLRSNGTSIWLDCGPGTLANLQEHVALEDLTAIVVTHAHADHWGELPVAHVGLQHYANRRHVPVYGTAETKERVEVGRGTDLAPAFDWTTVTDGSTFEIDGLRFTCSQTDHPVETLAVRVDEGDRSIAYTADTGPGWSVEAFGDGIDVALCEASTLDPDAGKYGHLTPGNAGASARAAGVERLVITHLVPGTDRDATVDRAREAFGGPVEVAATHLTIEV